MSILQITRSLESVETALSHLNLYRGDRHFNILTFIRINGFVVFDDGIVILTGTVLPNSTDILLGNRNTPAITEIVTQIKMATAR